MTLVKTSILTAISTIIKIISGFLINKIIAIYIGPSGLATIGQLQNFISIITTFSNGAINQGVTKYIAEDEPIEVKQKILSTSLVIVILSSSICSIFLVSLANYLSISIFSTYKYDSVFYLFGATVFLFALNSVLLAILNGQGEIKKFVLVNIFNSIVALLSISILIIYLNLLGALYALVINQSIVFFVSLLFVLKSKWFKWNYFNKGVDKDVLIKLSKFSFMAIVSALTVPVSQLVVRNYIGENLSWDDAGYWQGMWYISSMYLLIVTTSLNVYYLPKLSNIKDKLQLKKEIINGYKIIIPIVVVLSFIVYISRFIIIDIAFTPEFTTMAVLFKWQLIGDVLKIVAWMLGYILIAKAMTKIYIITEIIFALFFILLSINFVNYFGLIGMSYAFFMYNACYFIYLYIIVQKFYFNRTVL